MIEKLQREMLYISTEYKVYTRQSKININHLHYNISKYKYKMYNKIKNYLQHNFKSLQLKNLIQIY